MPKQPQADGYSPYRGKSKPHLLNRRRRTDISYDRPAPEPCTCPTLVLGSVATSTNAKQRDEALGPLLGRSHTANLILGR